jgi:uncharacterized protein YjiS (DUF1127 family)
MEPAMTFTSINRASVRVRRLPRWTESREILIEWRQRIYSRYELSSLDERELWDVGLVRMDADIEAEKPFWRR